MDLFNIQPVTFELESDFEKKHTCASHGKHRVRHANGHHHCAHRAADSVDLLPEALDFDLELEEVEELAGDFSEKKHTCASKGKHRKRHPGGNAYHCAHRH